MNRSVDTVMHDFWYISEEKVVARIVQVPCASLSAPDQRAEEDFGVHGAFISGRGHGHGGP